MKKLLFISVMMGSLSLGNNYTGLVASAQNKPEQKCNISAFILPQKVKNINIRSLPSVRSKIIGKLPTNTEGITVDIIGFNNGWVQINKAERRTTIFNSQGWIYAQFLGINTRGYDTEGVNLYINPDEKSEIVGKIPSNQTVKLLGCTDTYVKVQYKKLIGWLIKESQCPSPLTTCP